MTQAAPNDLRPQWWRVGGACGINLLLPWRWMPTNLATASPVPSIYVQGLKACRLGKGVTMEVRNIRWIGVPTEN